MSRWTSGPDGPEPGAGDKRPRRSRRAGRDRDANDFRERFGGARETGGKPPATAGDPPTPDSPAHPSLREPRSADRYVRGRTRLTVRELMEQMNAEEPPARRGPAPAASRQPAPDERPTAVHHFDVASPDSPAPAPAPDIEATQKIPPITSTPGVDLSDAATAERAFEESRAQESHAAPPPTTPPPATPVPSAPLEPTPDLTSRIAARPTPEHHPEKTAQRHSVRRRATVTGRVLVALACVTALVGTGFVWGYLKNWNGAWRTITAVDPDDANIRNKEGQYGDETYLIVGTDTRGGNNSRVGAGDTSEVEGARSDTVILVNIPANRSRVVAVSFPRDLQVDRPDCKQWNNDAGSYGDTLYGATGVKLNSVYADGGPQCLVRTLTAMSGLNINHFIAMDFYGFEKVVNAVGGVDVCSTTSLYDYELGDILKRPGHQTLKGRKALNYVRARTIASEGNGDYGRIKRQQLFMSSLLRSVLSNNVLSNPAKLNTIVNTFIRYSYVDGVKTESLLDLAESMEGIDAGKVSFITVPTTGTATDGSNNELPNTEGIDAIFNAIIDDQPLPREGGRKASTPGSSTTTGDSSSTPAPTTPETPTRVSATAQNAANVGVRVLNGTGRTGLAGEVSQQLANSGFDVRGVADASESRTDTVVRYGPGQQDAAATLAATIPGATIQSDRTVRSGVEVILGSGFTGSIGSVPEVGSAVSVDQLPPSVRANNLPNDLAITNAGDTTCS
ncbi:LCP family protein [Gordonia bronchialis]|uniref:LCP family protein n=1 Tax=Gordonia bronchialis TaxID=2054 RepID=UPI00242EBFF8|nr:LCP family protein [Gordonia bronchialis]